MTNEQTNGNPENDKPKWLLSETERMEWNGVCVGSIWEVDRMPSTHWVEKDSDLIEFSDSEVSSDGKLGAGSYFLTGIEGSGKHIAQLMKNGRPISVLISGKLLVVDAENQEEAATILGVKLGIEYSGGIHNLVKRHLHSRGNRIGDTIVDGVLMKDNDNGELVIFKPQGKVVIENNADYS